MRIIRMNRAAVQALKSDTVVPIGVYCYELFGYKTRPCKGCPIWQTIQKRSSHTAEIALNSLDKTYQVTGSPIFSDGNDFIGVVCDESSILKNYSGARRGLITEFMKKIPEYCRLMRVMRLTCMQ